MRDRFSWACSLCALLTTAVAHAAPDHHALRTGAPPALVGEDTRLAVAGGPPAGAYVSGPADAPHALLLLHEMWGLTPWVKAEADRWAADGYRVLALDLYDGVLPADSRRAYAAMRDHDPLRTRRVLGAALSLLGADGRPVGVLGWCFGGEQALAAALAHPDQVDAVVMYYGRPETLAGRLRALRAPVLGLFASEDSWVPRRQVLAFERAMARADRRLEVAWYAAGHAFANPSGAHHDAALAAAARRRAADFLARELAAAGLQSPPVPGPSSAPDAARVPPRGTD